MKTPSLEELLEIACFLFRHYEFRFNEQVKMLEYRQTELSPIQTNASYNKDTFTLFDKNELYTLSCFFKDQMSIRIAPTYILMLVKILLLNTEKLHIRNKNKYL